jgi:hypothetical protein
VAVPEFFDSLVWYEYLGNHMHVIGRGDALMIMRLLYALATSLLPYQIDECVHRKSQANADHYTVFPRPSRPTPTIPKAGHTHREVIDHLDDNEICIYLCRYLDRYRRV